MIVLDTNVLSALMRTAPDVRVTEWLDRQPADSIWITSVTLFETRYGLAILPAGRRRKTLEEALATMLERDLEHRVLEFDAQAAAVAAELAESRRRSGRSVELRDTMIAGTTLSRHATLATRNVKHFGDLRVPVINPWDG